MPARQGPLGKLSDTARHVVLPSGIVSTDWPVVRDVCAGFGVGFDAWQDGAGRAILARRADGSFACSIGGAVLSVPRQVGKTYLIGALAFARCLVTPGVEVIWTAHHSVTANETFRSMQGFARRRRVAPQVDKVMIDAMTIEFCNGSRIMFGARERGFGRGLGGTAILVFDEAQILTERALADMVPTMNTVADSLVLLIGTAPKPSDPSEAFSNRRTEALSGESDDMAYIEFSADRGCDPLDRRQWATANPSYPMRTNEAAMLRMRRNLALDSFTREALGIWDEAPRAAVSVIDELDWSALDVVAGPELGTLAYGVKFSPDGETVALSVALRSGDVVHVEGVEHRSMFEGTKWLVDWLSVRWVNAAMVVIDGRSGAGALERALHQVGIPARRLLRPTVEQVIAAHSMLVDAVAERTITHIGDEVLAGSVASAGRRPIGAAGGWGLQSVDGGDVTLIESVVLAHYGAVTAKGGRERVSRRREALVL